MEDSKETHNDDGYRGNVFLTDHNWWILPPNNLQKRTFYEKQLNERDNIKSLLPLALVTWVTTHERRSEGETMTAAPWFSCRLVARNSEKQ